MNRIKVVVAVVVLGLCAFAPAHAYTISTSVTTDGVQSSAGGWLNVVCRPAGSSNYGPCGSSVAAGTAVWIDAMTNDGYWFMWFTTSPSYLPGCTTLWGGWGYGPNPNDVCTFTMPASNVSISAEFQLP